MLSLLFYLKIDDYWLHMSAVPTLTPMTTRNKMDSSSTPTSKLMRSINIKKPSTSSTTSLSSFSNHVSSSPSSSPNPVNSSTSICIEPNVSGSGSFNSNSRLRLTNIAIKHLTLVELKYLKQICFNKLKTEFENGSNLQVRLSIPKGN